MKFNKKVILFYIVLILLSVYIQKLSYIIFNSSNIIYINEKNNMLLTVYNNYLKFIVIEDIIFNLFFITLPFFIKKSKWILFIIGSLFIVAKFVPPYIINFVSNMIDVKEVDYNILVVFYLLLMIMFIISFFLLIFFSRIPQLPHEKTN